MFKRILGVTFSLTFVALSASAEVVQSKPIDDLNGDSAPERIALSANGAVHIADGSRASMKLAEIQVRRGEVVEDIAPPGRSPREKQVVVRVRRTDGVREDRVFSPLSGRLIEVAPVSE